jgi:hypothetical protein
MKMSISEVVKIAKKNRRRTPSPAPRDPASLKP